MNYDTRVKWEEQKHPIILSGNIITLVLMDVPGLFGITGLWTKRKLSKTRYNRHM